MQPEFHNRFHRSSFPEKGFHRLIQAIEIVSDKYEDIRLVIIGEGAQRNTLEQEIKKCKLQKRVMLTGYRAKAKDYLPYFDVFVLPSVTEGMPITLFEAALAGIPIIATPVGGVPEVLKNGEAGILVQPKSKDIADSIAKLKTQPDLVKQITERAKTVLKGNYSCEYMALEYLNLYYSLIEQSKNYEVQG